MNLKLVIAYDGSAYFGWQKTAAGPTIEQELQLVLERLLQQPVSLQAASRTDLGVHAEGQVVNLVLSTPFPLDRLQRACNGLLPPDIRVLEICEVPAEFHPTLDATGKEYHYHICNSPVQLPHHRLYAWHIPKPLDLQAMEEAASYLLGRHSFRAFCNVRKNLNYASYLREVTGITFTSSPAGRLTIAIRANQFLYKMARNIVGTLAYVGLGILEAGAIPQIIASEERKQAGITAPAQGLTLKRVFYQSAL